MGTKKNPIRNNDSQQITKINRKSELFLGTSSPKHTHSNNVCCTKSAVMALVDGKERELAQVIKQRIGLGTP
jgi:hypothetical protein